MFLTTQYYRPPFPDRRHWREDLRAIRAAGLTAIDFWAVWGWYEPAPGQYVFDDSDELVELAKACDLNVIITAVAEMHPHWIHREITDAHMIDHLGRRVDSTTLAYCHHGLHPGGCTDHPEVRRRLTEFLTNLARRYSTADNLLIWDCWNEMRFTVQTEGHVCYCSHTLASYRDWLRNRYGDIANLNETWRRRFITWEDVPPGKLPGGSWIELLEWQRFMANRTEQMLSIRANALRAGDRAHPILAHSVILSPYMTTGESPWEPSGNRGNDWELASRLDGFGASYFPAWFGGSPSEHGAKLECTRSASGRRPNWVRELQGGAARKGLNVMQSVTAQMQARWIWTAVSRGVHAVTFWCWRDEVFGRESSGFGVVGDDGYAADRVAAITSLTAVLREHRELFDSYRPVSAKVGVIFDSLNHQLEWAQYGRDSAQSGNSVKAYLQCLERLQLPYDVLDAAHLVDLRAYSVLVLPWPLIVRPELASALEAWVRAGGTLLTESELDAYDEHGFYRIPNDRPFARALGIQGQGRREIRPSEEIRFSIGQSTGLLRPATWLEPLSSADANVIASGSVGALLIQRSVGMGTVFAIGTHAGLAYTQERYADFELFLGAVMKRAAVEPAMVCSIRDGDVLQFRHGRAGAGTMLFITNAGPAVDAVFSWTDSGIAAGGSSVRDLVTGRVTTAVDANNAIELRLSVDAGGSHVLSLGGL